MKEGAQRTVYFYPSLFQGFSPTHLKTPFTFEVLLLWCPWTAVGMGVGRLLLPLLLLGLSEALRDEWKPGNYENTVSDATRFLDMYNSTAEEVFFYSVSASWNYNTNITTHNSQLQVGHPSVWTQHF